MADLRSCLRAAAEAGELSEDAAVEYIQRLDDLEADAGGLGFHESKVRAAQILEAHIQRTNARKKRMKIKQAAKLDIIRNRVLEAPAGTRDKAALSVLDFDPSLAHTGENVAMRHATTRGTAFALMHDFIDKFRSKRAGLKREIAGIEDIVAGLFGEKTTDAAEAMAGGIMRARKFLVGRHNFAGGDIVSRDNWGWVQKHDRQRIAAVEKEEWSAFVLERLDPARMLGPDGTPMSTKQIIQAVDGSYARIIGGDLEEMAGGFDETFTSPINARIAHRELVFRDSTAWLEYQRRFGDDDIFSAITGEIDRLSRDVAMIEVMGPYPRATLKTMEQMIDADRSSAAQALTGKKAAKQAESVGKHTILRATFDQVNGTANIPANAGWARVSQSNRNLVVSARLGSALFVSLGDAGTNTLTANMNGMPIAGLLREIFQQVNPKNPAHRRQAARMGYIAETWVGHAIGAQRLMGEVTGSVSTARMADTVLRAGGLNAWTDGGRAAFKLELNGLMTDEAGKAFRDVNPALRASMERHGVTPADWDMFRSTPLWTDPETGADFIRPEDVWLEFNNMSLPGGEAQARFDAAQRIGQMIAIEGNFAVVTPTARARAFATGGTASGSFWGENVRNLTLFRSFAVTYTYLHYSRMMALRGISSKAKYAAWIAISMTGAGAIAEQASSIFRGKDPRDMSEPKFWASAAIRGGSLGPLGDFIYSSTSRHGDNLAEGILGPVLGSELGALNKLTLGNIQELIEKGEAENVGAEFTRFADGLIPGRSLWYTRGAMDRLIGDELVAWTDANASERFRRIERNAKRDYNQRFWWRPGRALPDRAPSASAAIGGK